MWRPIRGPRQSPPITKHHQSPPINTNHHQEISKDMHYARVVPIESMEGRSLQGCQDLEGSLNPADLTRTAKRGGARISLVCGRFVPLKFLYQKVDNLCDVRQLVPQSLRQPGYTIGCMLKSLGSVVPGRSYKAPETSGPRPDHTLLPLIDRDPRPDWTTLSLIDWAQGPIVRYSRLLIGPQGPISR